MFLTPEERARFEAEMAAEYDHEQRSDEGAGLLVLAVLVCGGVIVAALGVLCIVIYGT